MSETQKTSIFRQKTLDRLSSPEQLTDYLRVTNVGLWVIIAVIILLLVGLFTWATLGQLETTVPAKLVVQDGTAQMTVLRDAAIAPGMTVRAGGEEFQISQVQEGDLGLPAATAPVNLANGNYDAAIVVESVSPISFLLGI